MLRRKTTGQLIQWKNRKSKKAVFLHGARQTGKTTVLREFGKANFTQMIEVNFLEHPEINRLFQGTESADEMVRALLEHSKIQTDDEEMFLFLDEIHACPEALSVLHKLVQDGRFWIAVSGALHAPEMESQKAAAEEVTLHLSLYPLDFEEFLWALDTEESIIALLRNCLKEEASVPEYIHSQIMQRYIQYLITGGMPEAVVRYLQNRNIPEVIELQKNIVASLYQSIARDAAKKDRIRSEDLFSQIPCQLNRQNQRFFLNQIQKGARYSAYAPSLLWIADSGLALPCHNTEKPQFPLEQNAKDGLFKLFFLDTGLLCSCYEGVQLSLLQGDDSLNCRAVLENAAAQAFAASGFELFYFSSKKYGEIDFVLQQGQRIILAEIKSGANYEKHPSLDKICAVPDWSFADSIVFCRDNVQRKNGILYLPLYMMGFLTPRIQDHE